MTLERVSISATCGERERERDRSPLNGPIILTNRAERVWLFVYLIGTLERVGRARELTLLHRPSRTTTASLQDGQVIIINRTIDCAIKALLEISRRIWIRISKETDQWPSGDLFWGLPALTSDRIRRSVMRRRYRYTRGAYLIYRSLFHWPDLGMAHGTPVRPLGSCRSAISSTPWNFLLPQHTTRAFKNSIEFFSDNFVARRRRMFQVISEPHARTW